MTDDISTRTTSRTVVVVGDGGVVDRQDEAGEIVEVQFRGFDDLPSERGESVSSPDFACFGHEWDVQVFPGGTVATHGGQIGLFLNHMSPSRDGSIDLELAMSVKYRSGKYVAHYHCQKKFRGDDYGGDKDFAGRSDVLNTLVGGALIVEVRMKQIGVPNRARPFIPENPLCKNILKRFNEEETSDVVFEVGCDSMRGRESRKKAKTSPVTFYAHRLVLQDSATTLSELVKSANDTSPIQITDVKSEIFHLMLHYVYGGDVAEEELKENAKDLIDASDKYGIVNLKLEAEACYAKSVELTVDNVVDNLLYADSKNCAYLKEVVVDFVAENGKDILGKVSFENVPGAMMTDLLAATTRRERPRDDGYETMRVSTLRRKLHEKGLDIDGSREAMIALLEENTESIEEGENAEPAEENP